VGAKVWVGPIAMAPNLVAFFPFRISVFMIDAGRNHLKYHENNLIYVCFFKFVMYPYWQSSTGGIIKKWLQVREESRKF
jgi:hypothetical protein